MTRKPVRLGLLIVGLLVTAGLGYRAVEDEASLGRAAREGTLLDRTAEQALQALLDLRGSLHAYVAPGQGVAFWSGRAEETLDALRQRLVTLDSAVSPIGGSLSETLDAVDQLAAAERRARGYAGRGETLLAGDVVFTEVRDLLSASIAAVQDVRGRLAVAHDRRTSALRQEQAALAAAGVATWLIIALLLVPAPPPEVVKKKGDEWRQELAETIKKPIIKEPAEPVRAKPVEAVERVEPAVPAEPAVTVKALREVGEICSDLSTLADTGALTGALQRASDVLNASGLIVWVASNDAGSLAPVATWGFDPKLVARIGRIARDSSNMTAAAFRENAPRVSAATATAPAAIAVSLCGPTGPVGVLSAELQDGVPADEGRVALATIFAAQLATLAMPIPAAPPKVEGVKTAAI